MCCGTFPQPLAVHAMRATLPRAIDDLKGPVASMVPHGPCQPINACQMLIKSLELFLVAAVRADPSRCGRTSSSPAAAHRRQSGPPRRDRRTTLLGCERGAPSPQRGPIFGRAESSGRAIGISRLGRVRRQPGPSCWRQEVGDCPARSAASHNSYTDRASGTAGLSVPPPRTAARWLVARVLVAEGLQRWTGAHDARTWPSLPTGRARDQMDRRPAPQGSSIHPAVDRRTSWRGRARTRSSGASIWGRGGRCRPIQSFA